ncbi:MAG: hypothetical protein NTZ05_16250 [Chloroflexi bacterium]|nr:hypothetical protein [Chloroflexota bacterium]
MAETTSQSNAGVVGSGEGMMQVLGESRLLSHEFQQIESQRRQRRERELRADKARMLGRLARELRWKKGWDRGEVVQRGSAPARLAGNPAQASPTGGGMMRLGGLSLQWLYLLEHELLEFDDLRRQWVERLAGALEVHAPWMAQMCDFSLDECRGEPVLAVLGVGVTAERFLQNQPQSVLDTRPGQNATTVGYLKLADARSIDSPDYLHDRFVGVRPTGAEPAFVSLAAFLEDADMLLLVADLDEHECRQVPLTAIMRYASVDRGLLTAALLPYRPSIDRAKPVPDENNPTGTVDRTLRERLAPYLHLSLAILWDNLEGIAGNDFFLSPERLAHQECSRILGDLLLSLQDQELTSLRDVLSRNRPAALGVARGDITASSRQLAEGEFKSVTEASLDLDAQVIMVTVQTAALTPAEQEALYEHFRSAIRNTGGGKAQIHIVQSKLSPGEAARMSILKA